MKLKELNLSKLNITDRSKFLKNCFFVGSGAYLENCFSESYCRKNFVLTPFSLERR